MCEEILEFIVKLGIHSDEGEMLVDDCMCERPANSSFITNCMF